MALLEFAKALPRILVYEGGKVDDPRDPGGRTNKGITQATYNAFRRKLGLPVRDVWLITDAEVATIYKTMYWDKARGDQLQMGLGLVVFDAGINSGVGRAGIWLQQALGDHYKGQVDGLLGDKTLQAVQDFDDVEELITRFCEHRLGTLKRLKTWSIYGKGWSARIANVQKTGIAWANAVAAPHPVDVSNDNGHRKALLQDVKSPPVGQLTTHISTAAGSVGTIASETAQQLTPVTDSFGWVKYVFGGLTIAAIVAGIVVKMIADAKDAAEKGTATATVDIDADDNSVPVPVNDNAPAPVEFVDMPATGTGG